MTWDRDTYVNSNLPLYFDFFKQTSKYKGKFEFTYVSLSQVIVKKIDSGQRLVLKSA